MCSATLLSCAVSERANEQTYILLNSIIIRPGYNAQLDVLIATQNESIEATYAELVRAR